MNRYEDVNFIPPGGLSVDDLLEEIHQREQVAAAHGYMAGVRDASSVRPSTGAEDASIPNAIQSFITSAMNKAQCLPGFVSYLYNKIVALKDIRRDVNISYLDAQYVPTAPTIAAAKDDSNPEAQEAARRRIRTGIEITLLRKILRGLISDYNSIKMNIKTPESNAKMVRAIFKHTLYLLNSMNEHSSDIADMMIALRVAPNFGTRRTNMGSSGMESQEAVMYNTGNMNTVEIMRDVDIQTLNSLIISFPSIATEYLLEANVDVNKLPTITNIAAISSKIAALQASEQPAAVEKCDYKTFKTRITSVSSEPITQSNTVNEIPVRKNVGASLRALTGPSYSDRLTNIAGTVASAPTRLLQGYVGKQTFPFPSSQATAGPVMPTVANRNTRRAPKRARNNINTESHKIQRLNNNIDSSTDTQYSPSINTKNGTGNGNKPAEGGRRYRKKTQRRRRTSVKKRRSFYRQ